MTMVILAADSSFGLFVQRLVDGLARGSIYALLALALVVVFRGSGQLNFAQGEMGMFCAFVTSTLTLSGVPVWLSILLAMCVGFAMGVGIERIVVRPLEHKNPGGVLVAAIGLFLLINSSAIAIWGVDARGLPSVFPSDEDAFFRLFGAAVRWERVGIFFTMIALLVLLWLLFTKTKVGLAMRAVANNQDSSKLVGIRVGRVLALGWGLSGAIGALGACLLAPQAGLTQALMLGPFILASAAAVLGGLDSPLGAVVGGLSIGLIEAMIIGYVGFLGGSMVVTVVFVIILGVLLFKPTGLFGSTRVERV
jgi:branched-chain amino acid transport system permease protein